MDYVGYSRPNGNTRGCEKESGTMQYVVVCEEWRKVKEAVLVVKECEGCCEEETEGKEGRVSEQLHAKLIKQ